MADGDWAECANNISGSNVLRGVTDAASIPNGGGSFTYGMHSVAAVSGAVGLYVDLVNYNPTASNKGGRISFAMRKGSGSSSLDYNPMAFMCLQSADVTANGYLLGFTSDENPAHLVLCKGAFDDGIQTTTSDILRQSTGSYSSGTWYHFQLDVITQPSGDVKLQVKENDLGSNSVSSPSFAAIGGMAEYTDGVLYSPYTEGFIGFGAYIGGVSGRICYFDHVVAGRQT